MSVTLKLKHLEGLRLRNQSAHKIARTGKEGDGGTVIKGEEWKFDPDDCKQDEDQRKVEADGSHVKLGTYTVYITAGLKNLVVERKGKVEHVDFKNSALRNQLRIRYQKLVDENAGKEGKKPHLIWKPEGQPQYIPANTWTGVFVGDGQRAIVDEMPT
jgi:hypothetical protein